MDDKLLHDMVERLARIETKIDNYEALREKADKAFSMGLNNTEQIKEIKLNNRWAWGFIIGLGITIIGYFLTKL